MTLTLALILTTATTATAATPLIDKTRDARRLTDRVRVAKCLEPVARRYELAHQIPVPYRRPALRQERARALKALRASGHRCWTSPRAAITHVFGRYAGQALAVAWCESRLSVYARNGQYLGLFQMGSYARGRYGHSWTALGQSRAAYRYFRDAGSDWSPWECKP